MRLVEFYRREGIVFDWEFFELFDCSYGTGHFLSPLPQQKKKYDYDAFLNDLYSEKLQGYVVLRGLSIKKSSRNPFHGFIPVKACISKKNWSPITNALNPNLKPLNQAVIGVHETSDIG